ncbi:MAG: hypothetical protein JW953_15715 [Anaerolineae bacterium]|nr:hypothetical protein [Anaerolineae bacterium]
MPIIFSSALTKKYIVQTRYKSGVWKEHASFRSLAQAKQAIQQLKRQNSEIESRILNRFTRQVVKF